MLLSRGKQEVHHGSSERHQRDERWLHLELDSELAGCCKVREQTVTGAQTQSFSPACFHRMQCVSVHPFVLIRFRTSQCVRFHWPQLHPQQGWGLLLPSRKIRIGSILDGGIACGTGSQV